MSEEHPPRKRIKRPRLADDGQPLEMFQDVKRACHRWLMAGKGNECDAYRMEQRMIERRFGNLTRGTGDHDDTSQRDEPPVDQASDDVDEQLVIK